MRPAAAEAVTPFIHVDVVKKAAVRVGVLTQEEADRIEAEAKAKAAVVWDTAVARDGASAAVTFVGKGADHWGAFDLVPRFGAVRQDQEARSGQPVAQLARCAPTHRTVW